MADLTPEDRARIGSELLALRLSRGFKTIQALSAHVGISAKTIGMAERGAVVSQQTISVLRASLSEMPRRGLGPGRGTLIPASSDLDRFSTVQLLEEVLNRIKKGGAADGTDAQEAAATSRAGVSPATVDPFKAPKSALRDAANTVPE